MSGRIEILTRPAWRGRWAARAPRIAVGLLIVVLAFAGLRVIVAGPPKPPATIVTESSQDAGAQGFAESFARSYFSWDPEHPERRERALASFVSADLDPGAGAELGTRPRRVEWTSIASVEQRAGYQLVTLACGTDTGLYYLAVAVSRDSRGFLYIGDYPAIVGPPPSNVETSHKQEDDVEDEQLRTIAERAIGNYLNGEKRNLLADLDPKAVIALPQPRLKVESVDEITWAAPSVVAVQLRARGESKDTFTLRYELTVVKRDRWYVRSIEVNPTASKGRTT